MVGRQAGDQVRERIASRARKREQQEREEIRGRLVRESRLRPARRGMLSEAQAQQFE